MRALEPDSRLARSLFYWPHAQFLFTLDFMDSDDLLAECDVSMQVFDEGKTVTLIFKADVPFSVGSFLIELKTYLTEYARAKKLLDEPGVRRH